MRDTKDKNEELYLALVTGKDEQIDPGLRHAVLSAVHAGIWPDRPLAKTPCQKRMVEQLLSCVQAAHDAEASMCRHTIATWFLEAIWPTD